MKRLQVPVDINHACILSEVVYQERRKDEGAEAAGDLSSQKRFEEGLETRRRQDTGTTEAERLAVLDPRRNVPSQPIERPDYSAFPTKKDGHF